MACAIRNTLRIIRRVRWLGSISISSRKSGALPLDPAGAERPQTPTLEAGQNTPGIRFVICGIEHSGTTLVADLFRQVPGLDSGFETGVLLSKSPRDFLTEMPFALNILGGWSMTQEELANCCDTDSFDEFYLRLQSISRVIEPDTSKVFDKTPRYLSQLEDCLSKIDVPFVVTYKDPRSIVFSDFTRSGSTNFDEWFNGYADQKLGYMRHLYAAFRCEAARGERVLRIGLENLCLEPRRSCEAIFAHCCEPFSLRYLLFKKLRYHHNRATSISPRIPFEYLDAFSADQLAMIVQRFAEFEDWFYD